MLSRRAFVGALVGMGASVAGLGLLGGCALRVSGPQLAAPLRARRIGYLSSNASGRGELDPFLQGLRELGYAEGREYTIETRYAELRSERAPMLATELVGLGVDVLLTEAYPAALAAKDATAHQATGADPIPGAPGVPVVFMLVTDPVGLGLVASLARPGGNVTGLSTLSPALSSKRMELLKAIAPGVSRVAVLHNPDNPSTLAIFQQTEAAGEALEVEVISVAVRVPEDVDAALAAALAGRAGALLPLPATPFQLAEQRARLLEVAASHRLPTVSTSRDYVQDGYLLGVGPRYEAIFRRAAAYVDKIFKGAHPADLPVEQPTTFDVVVNIKAAQALGLTIPPDVAAQVTGWVQ